MTSKCPLCESPCIIKIISTSDKKYGEVDVCTICGAMYPRKGSTKAKLAAAAKPAKKKPARRTRKK